MCGRFVSQQAPEIPARFDAAVTPAVQLQLTPRYNVAPTQPVPVIVAGAADGRRVELAQWGLTPKYAPKGKGPIAIFNARSETVLEKAGFRRLLSGGRCLIPADGFYEWEKVGGAKLPWLYRLKDGGMFAFAGLYEHRTDAEGRELTACTVLTTAPNELVLPVHGRMPVILPREAEGDWLDPAITEPHELLPLLAPYPAGRMERVAVSKAVNSSRVDDPSLVQPVAA